MKQGARIRRFGWCRAASWALLTLAAYGCGGSVRFVPQNEVDETPPPPPAPPTIFEDRFVYGRPSGRSVVAFIVYPRKSMAIYRERLRLYAYEFADALFRGADGYTSVGISIVRDVSQPMAQLAVDVREPTFPRAAWPQLVRNALENEFDAFAIEHVGGESAAFSPFQVFQRAAYLAPGTSDEARSPHRLHLVYVRDRDWMEDEGEFQVRARESFENSLPLPLSPTRVSLHGLFYISEQSACAPLPSALSSRMRKLLAGPWLRTHELCELVTNPGALLRRLADEIHRDDSRLTLQARPRLDSLEVRVNGTPRPRHEVRWDEATHDLHFAADAAPAAGDEVVATYERAE